MVKKHFSVVAILSIAPCSFGLSATSHTSQRYFSLRTNQPPAISQQYFSLRTNQHQPPVKRTGCKLANGYMVESFGYLIVIGLSFFHCQPLIKEERDRQHEFG
jgi:hypothetical protein